MAMSPQEAWQGTSVQAFMKRLIAASYHKAGEFKQHFPSVDMVKLMDKAAAYLKSEPTLLEVGLYERMLLWVDRKFV